MITVPLEETPVNNDREVKDEIMFSVIKNRVRITTSQKRRSSVFYFSLISIHINLEKEGKMNSNQLEIKSE